MVLIDFNVAFTMMHAPHGGFGLFYVYDDCML
jgi:hypothetical protein